MDRLNQVTQHCFDAVTQVRRADVGALPKPELLHHRMKDFVDDLMREAGDAGFSQQDTDDIAYAVVALIDEVVLGKGEALRQYWMSNLLQMHFFNENVAGDGFFERLGEIRGDSQRHEVLRAYYLCLVLGFQGRHKVRGGDLELMTLTDTVQKELGKASEHDIEVLSPSGERPPDTFRASRSSLILLALGGGAVLLAMLIYGAMFVSLRFTVNGTRAEIEKIGTAPLPGAR